MQLEQVSRETIISKLGGYNSMPPNWELITLSEYLWRFNVAGYETTRHRQVKLPSLGMGETEGFSRETWVSVYMHIARDFSGIGMIVHYNGMATRSEIDAYQAQYFKFHVCDHDYETTRTANCYWEGTCRKCGYVKAIDSSG